MSLISMDDVGFILFFILPGYVSLVLFQSVSLTKPLEKEFDKIGYSLFSSTIIFAIYARLNNIYTFESIFKSFDTFSNFLVIMVYGVLLGLSFGLFVYVVFRKGIIRGSGWNYFFDSVPSKGAWITIATKRKREYLGKISKSSRSEKRGSVVIIEPKLMVRDATGAVDYHQELGKLLLVLESEIESVVYVDE